MLSPPSRGAWIEIACASCRAARIASPPSRGAWIEIRNAMAQGPNPGRRPPRGGRGLKYGLLQGRLYLRRVAPLAGGVD